DVRKKGPNQRGRNDSGSKFLFYYGEEFVFETIPSKCPHIVKKVALNMNMYVQGMDQHGNIKAAFEEHKNDGKLLLPLKQLKASLKHGTVVTIPCFRDNTFVEPEDVIENMGERLGSS